jgi:hypothetical protein
LALSSDPEKRARSLANLKRGKQTAAAPPPAAPAKDLPVVPYADPKPPAKATPAPARKPSAPPAAKPPAELSPAAEPGGMPWIVIGGALALVVLVLLLNRTGGPRDE